MSQILSFDVADMLCVVSGEGPLMLDVTTINFRCCIC
jgi:hypothetical protein